MSRARSPSSSYSTLPSLRVTVRTGPKRCQPPIEPWLMCQPGPSKPMPTTLVAEMPSGPHTRAPVKRPPSPASPPDTTTPPLPSVPVRPSTSALPLMPAPWPSTSTCRRSGWARRAARRWPAASESAMSASSTLATRKAGWRKRSAVMTMLPSPTPWPDISPAVEQPTHCAWGIRARMRSASSACMASRLANTSTRWGCKLANGATSAGVMSVPWMVTCWMRMVSSSVWFSGGWSPGSPAYRRASGMGTMPP